MAYNEIEIQISTDQNGYEEETPLRSMIGYKYIKCDIVLTHSIAKNKVIKDKVNVIKYSATASDVIEAARQCFQNVLDKVWCDKEIKYWSKYNVEYSGHWRNLPWHLEISDHTPEMQELIRSVFSGGEVFEAKGFLEA